MKPDMYSGYRPYHLRESLFAWPPGGGSRSELANKFHAPWRIETQPDAAGLSASAYTQGSTNISPGDFTVPSRNLGLQILPMEKPSVPLSQYARDYVDFPLLVARARSVPSAALEAAVDALDANNDGFICLREVRDALTRAYHACKLGDPEEPLTASLGAIFEREGVRLKDGSIVIPREMFVAALPIAADFWVQDLALMRPEVLGKSGSLIQKNILAATVGPQPPRNYDKPAPRRLPPASPMRSATGHLFETFAAASAANTSAASTLSSPQRETGGGGLSQRNALPAGQRA